MLCIGMRRKHHHQSTWGDYYRKNISMSFWVNCWGWRGWFLSLYFFNKAEFFEKVYFFFSYCCVEGGYIYICENECVILGIETWFITCENRKGCSYIHNHGRIYYKSMTNFVQIWIANRNLWFFFFFDFCYFWLLNYF